MFRQPIRQLFGKINERGAACFETSVRTLQRADPIGDWLHLRFGGPTDEVKCRCWPGQDRSITLLESLAVAVVPIVGTGDDDVIAQVAQEPIVEFAFPLSDALLAKDHPEDLRHGPL